MEAVDPACGVRRLVEVAENATRALKKHGARIGRRDPSGGPQQQLDAEPGLQARDHTRHRRLRQAELPGGLRKAAGFGRPDEHGQFLKIITHT